MSIPTKHTIDLRKKLTDNRGELNRIIRKHKLHNLRVFGSVAKGTANNASDIDFLVAYKKGNTYFNLFRANAEISELLGYETEMFFDNELKEHVAFNVKNNELLFL